MIRPDRHLNPVLLLVCLVVLLPPVALLLYAAGRELIQTGFQELASFLFSPRRVRLLGRTLLLGTAVTAVGLSLGLVTALFLWRARTGRLARLRWLVACFLIVPSYVHTQTWIFATDALRDVLQSMGLPFLPFSGFHASVVVQVFATLPIPILLLLAGLETFSPAVLDSLRLESGGRSMLRRMILPQLAPYLLASAGVLLILSLSDYSVPSVFQYNVYALDLFAEFSSTHAIGPVSLMSLPMLLGMLLLLALLSRELNRRRWHSTGSDRKRTDIRFLAGPGFGIGTRIVACGTLVLLLLLPLAFLVLNTGSPAVFLDSVRASTEEINNTLLLSLLTALFSIPVTALGAWSLSRKGWSSVSGWLLLLPALLPSSLLGIGAAVWWNRPLFDAVSTTLIPSALILCARFSFFGALVQLAASRSVRQEQRDIGRVYGKSLWHAWRRGILPQVLPSVLVSFLLVFALSAGELGTTLLICPPGQATLTLKIYNYLHYGASQTVASLCLFTTLLSLLCGTLVLWVHRSRRSAS